jgi:hypothetical protein
MVGRKGEATHVHCCIDARFENVCEWCEQRTRELTHFRPKLTDDSAIVFPLGRSIEGSADADPLIHRDDDDGGATLRPLEFEVRTKESSSLALDASL